MNSRRLLKAAEAIREVVSMSILVELTDPRICDVTVTYVEVAPDMRMARVHVSIMGDETKQNLCLRGLESASGFLQSKVGNRIDTRYTPKLRFVLDQGVKHSLAVARILNEVLPEGDDANATPIEAETSDDLSSDISDNSNESSINSDT
ncbi:MAG: 30S ribosome-binding factor RbfA [Planctomycetaceae bacterium]|nr:30S ribosome-binding factor RbfA [Planctomycetales bacterium]MCB9875158.1 30S ribosome-binding factor RbfA [Planctomycetaceae bacterium]MCB9940253.1 30S ribosome-binding factor RbfA [Planctomycetaceae bacterium]HRX79880.1 30S ribosome-binding factor RbfA [Pirellulaceae bacterium]